MTHASEAHRWADQLDDLVARIAPRFSRIEPRRQAGLYLEGLLSAVERKNGWQLAEHLGDARPWRSNGCSHMCSGTRRRCAICVAPTWLRPWPIGKRC